MMYFVEKESHRKWEYHSPKGTLLLICRKDAGKYLNNALKRQRKGYSRAGLGFDDTKKKSEQPMSALLNLA